MQIDHSENIVELKNISFAYGGKNVLEDITFNVHKGDYLGIVGPNGGGKTTLLKIIIGLLTPSHGTVHLFGQDICCFNKWSKIGYVPQKATNFDNSFPLTVEEVVTMGRYGKPKNDKIVLQSLKQVEMLEFRNKLIGDLSGGQQQRVFIAKALAGEPEIIFLDEPTVGVDLKTQEQFYRILKDLNKKLKLTLVLISHDIDVIASETTEIACVNKKLIYDNNPENFLRSEKLKKLYGSGVKFVFHTH
ncbi:Zinc uptake system ATP-binding protein ZurA [Candidatus Roizmanbacteria bacterium]|nr:Zinc uptake system ATP-binding protein ZurA [Candidatus Roizmanbacteria bacterium]